MNNIAWGYVEIQIQQKCEAKCCICLETPSNAVLFYTRYLNFEFEKGSRDHNKK